eukprot:gene28456-31603_t
MRAEFSAPSRDPFLRRYRNAFSEGRELSMEKGGSSQPVVLVSNRLETAPLEVVATSVRRPAITVPVSGGAARKPDFSLSGLGPGLGPGSWTVGAGRDGPGSSLPNFEVQRLCLVGEIFDADIETVPRPAGRSSAVRVRAGMEYDALKGIKVTSAKTGEERELLALWEPRDSNMVVVPFLTHFADLSSWELGQKLIKVMPTLEASSVKVVVVGLGSVANARVSDNFGEGDSGSWELGQKLIKVMPTLEASSVKVVVVGLGSVANAREFCRVLKFPTENLYCDPDGIAYKALNFSPGFGPEMEISPYAKLLPMLMGIGSPGTLQEVIRGYVGDKGSKPVFEGATPFDILGYQVSRQTNLEGATPFDILGEGYQVSRQTNLEGATPFDILGGGYQVSRQTNLEGATPFDILGEGYQRPFELATLRLFNMIGIIPKWAELSPPREDLLTQQGGSVVFSGEETVFRHDDSGILKYTVRFL